MGSAVPDQTALGRVALAHHWLIASRGGEQVLAEVCRLFPDAPIHTLFGNPSAVPEEIAAHPWEISSLNRLPGGHERWLPLYPWALSRFDLSDYEVVITTDAACTKGIPVGPPAIHLCYCFAPMRYAFDFPKEYVERSVPAPLRPLAYVMLRALKAYDLRAAERVHSFATSSTAVADRIERHYGREARVIPPPVQLDRFPLRAPDLPREDYYLLAGQLVPYKRPDLAVHAFRATGRRLVVVGEGPMGESLRAEAGPEVEFLGRLPDEELAEHYRRCRALVFPGEEDFGIVPLEALASGTPVIAYRRGGVLDTLTGPAISDDGALGPWPDHANGLLFERQTANALRRAIDAFERHQGRFDPQVARRRAEEFSPQRFRSEFQTWVTEEVSRGRRAAA